MNKLRKLLESTLVKDFEIIKEETYIPNERLGNKETVVAYRGLELPPNSDKLKWYEYAEFFRKYNGEYYFEEGTPQWFSCYSCISTTYGCWVVKAKLELNNICDLTDNKVLHMVLPNFFNKMKKEILPQYYKGEELKRQLSIIDKCGFNSIKDDIYLNWKDIIDEIKKQGYDSIKSLEDSEDLMYIDNGYIIWSMNNIVDYVVRYYDCRSEKYYTPEQYKEGMDINGNFWYERLNSDDYDEDGVDMYESKQYKTLTKSLCERLDNKEVFEDEAFLGEQIAYCGSEKDYDVPDLKIIGNGEGTAVHGYGFYFAKDFNIANRYRMAYIKKPYSYIFKGIIYNKIDICSNINNDTMFKQIMYDLLKKIYHEKMTLNDVLQECKNEIEYYDNSIKNVNKDKKDYIKFCKICLNGYINAKKFFINVNEEDINNIQIYGGQVLKVELPEDEYLIDEQKSLKEQSEYVKNILYKIFKKLNIDYNEDMSGEDILIDISNANMLKNKGSHLPLSRNRYELSDDIRDFYYENQKNVYIFGSLMLANNGIKGITYIGNEDGRCYVIFDPNDIKIIDKLIKENYNNIISNDSDILMEGIEEIKKYFPNIPEEKFQQLVDLDPTYTGGKKLGKFGKWILSLYNKGQLKDEDFYKVTEYLITFKNNLQKIQNKDIMSYKTLPDLAKAIQGYENQEDVSNRQQVRNIKKDVKKVKETNEWLIISPKTEQSACYYGANTKWCTAGKNHNMFDYYNDQGSIYIFINKLNNKKYQFHAESFQFMNELDEPTAPTKVIKDKELLDFIEEKLFNYIHSDDYDCYEECPLYGVYPNNDYYAVTTDDIENFFSMFYSDEDSETLNIIEKWWYNEDIDEIIEIIRKLSYYDELDEKAKEIGFDSYEDILNSIYFEKDFKDKMKEIDKIIIGDLFNGSPINSYRIIDIEHSTDNENMFAYLSMNDQIQNYDDFLVEWFMTSNKNVYQDVLSYVLENTDTSNISIEIREFLFNLVNDIKNNPDQLSLDFKESVIKNPKNIMVESYLKSSPLRFAFNPMNNDFIITDISHNPIPLNESNEKYITGMLSPNLVEIISNIADDYNDSKEIVENLLGKRFKEIFKNHYEIIL